VSFVDEQQGGGVEMQQSLMFKPVLNDAEALDESVQNLKCNIRPGMQQIFFES
jgi:hypothetical protein